MWFNGLNITAPFADCPLDFTGSNFTLASSLCSNHGDRGKYCRYINTNVAISIAHFANATSNLGVLQNASDTCLQTIFQTLQLNGVAQNATTFCGFGTKILVNYECRGRTSVVQMLQSPLGEESKCKKFLNIGFGYLHHIGIEDNISPCTCRDATFVVLASQVDEISIIDIAICFFGVQGLLIPLGKNSFKLIFFNKNYCEALPLHVSLYFISDVFCLPLQVSLCAWVPSCVNATTYII